ncbi:14316_t:CDS:2 [Dentiscutata heterogama]|uniref:14316_t:CDS:1 n=1 Tax=Dentiscutata heterogama TaxID=1316150 RepID=A0ACA9K0G8_9GLOM|nr:14316_t:CDS:2 [Dentiscutata heterogama]
MLIGRNVSLSDFCSNFSIIVIKYSASSSNKFGSSLAISWSILLISLL